MQAEAILRSLRDSTTAAAMNPGGFPALKAEDGAQCHYGLLAQTCHATRAFHNTACLYSEGSERALAKARYPY